jgi:hypothetical protein
MIELVILNTKREEGNIQSWRDGGSVISLSAEKTPARWNLKKLNREKYRQHEPYRQSPVMGSSGSQAIA